MTPSGRSTGPVVTPQALSQDHRAGGELRSDVSRRVGRLVGVPIELLVGVAVRRWPGRSDGRPRADPLGERADAGVTSRPFRCW